MRAATFYEPRYARTSTKMKSFVKANYKRSLDSKYTISVYGNGNENSSKELLRNFSKHVCIIDWRT